jgi:alpha-methylacyl-CoA racemase
VLGLDTADPVEQHDQAGWPAMRETLRRHPPHTHARDKWVALAAGTESCIAPVLSLAEVPSHPQVRARRTFVHRAADVGCDQHRGFGLPW